MRFEDYLRMKIKKNISEGYKPKQAIAIAYSQADKAFGYPRVIMAHAGELVVPVKYANQVAKYMKKRGMRVPLP